MCILLFHFFKLKMPFLVGSQDLNVEMFTFHFTYYDSNRDNLYLSGTIFIIIWFEKFKIFLL